MSDVYCVNGKRIRRMLLDRGENLTRSRWQRRRFINRSRCGCLLWRSRASRTSRRMFEGRGSQPRMAVTGGAATPSRRVAASSPSWMNGRVCAADQRSHQKWKGREDRSSRPSPCRWWLLIDRGSCASSGCGSGASACAAPLPRSGGYARASR